MFRITVDQSSGSLIQFLVTAKHCIRLSSIFFKSWFYLPYLCIRVHWIWLFIFISPANPTSSRPQSWSLGNATLVVTERSGWRRVLGASKPRPPAKGAHPYRKWACLEALRLAATKLTQRGTGYPSWGHPTQLIISRGTTGLKRWREQL